jgi:hypothetical protein
MWAGYIALVNQQLVANGKPTIGFLNPTIYQQNVTSSYATDFHDITSGTSGSYSAVTGYDLVTGWGSPTPALIAALTGATQSPNFSLSASPTSVSIAPGSGGSSTITSTVSGGFSSTVTLSASGQPSGVTVTFNPTGFNSGAGSSTMAITVAAGTVAGTYPITITGTGGGLTKTTSVSLVVTGTTPSFAISASPTSITLGRNASGTIKITSTAAGGFSGTISLSASGQGTNNTVSFSPTSITGAGSSTMTVHVGRKASFTTHTITVTGTSGGVSHTATVTLTVN